MDLALNIAGDSTGGAQALTDLVTPAQASAKAIEDAFASMAKKTDAAFKQMEKERVAEAKKSADAIAEAEKKSAETIIAANKKIADAHHEQLVQQQADYLEHREKTKAMWAEVGQAVMVAGAAVVAFGVASVKAFMEAERIQKQLERAAGEYAEALSAQADAMEELFNVDGEVIKQSQTLLVQWGGVGAASQEVTKAVLDYAAATGQDAVTATQELLRNVESGGTGLAKLGVHFEATGNRGEDLKRIVAALGKKFGGAAAADADSLHGQVEATRIAFGNMMEDFGQLIAAFATKTNIIEKVRDAMKSWREILNGGSEEQKRNEAYLAMQEKIAKALDDRAGWLTYINHKVKEGDLDGAERGMRRLAALDAEIAKLKQLRDATNAAHGAGVPGVGTVTGETNKGMKEKEAAAAAHATKMEEIQRKNAEANRKAWADDRELEEHARAQDQQNYADDLALSGKRVADAQKEAAERVKVRQEMLTAIEKANAEHAEKEAKELHKAQEKTSKEAADRLAKQAAQWKSAADQIGSAFVNALSDQLSKLAEGGEFDAALFIGDILAAAVGIAGSVIGTAFGQPALGAALGNLAAMGVRAGASAISKGGKRAPRTMHAGGWVGDEIDIPRHHSGAWIGADERAAILQTGERVLSRAEVHHAGGAGAVDNMARGGGSRVTLNVTAIDAKSIADTFSGAGADGLKQALRRGHGALPALLGRGPR